MAWFNLILSPTCPVNDFNVNQPTYLYNFITAAPKAESFGDKSTTTLIESIRNKRATMLSCYINIPTGFQPNNSRLLLIQRIFLNKG